ncbi:MAG: hypothetical protein ACREP9_13595, partial [Candidatus Dormibacteraceae bacterium]
ISGEEPRSLRSVAHELGISPATVKSWSDKAGLQVTLDGADTSLAEGQAVGQTALKKARALMAGIQKLDSKSQLERSGAIKNLADVYLKLQGVAVPESQTNTQVNIVLEDLLRRVP